jgi:gamma-glutamyltranspeptidase
LRDFGAQLTWSRTLQPAQTAAASGVPVAASLAAHIGEAEADTSADFERVFRPNGRPRRVGEHFVQPELAQSIATLRENGPDEFYEGGLAERMVAYLQTNGSVLDTDDFAVFRPEITEPIGLAFRGLTVMTSPPNTQGFLLLRALNAVDQLGIADPLGEDLGSFMKVMHSANGIRSRFLADPRYAQVNVQALVHDGLKSAVDLRNPGLDGVDAAHGDTVGIAAADSDGYAVSLIQSVFHSFGSWLIDPDTGILFQNRGTGFSLTEGSPNVIAPRKRPAHTLMPVMTTQDSRLRHVLATMGGQGQPQILAQVLLRAIGGASVEEAIAAPRAILGQLDGYASDTVAVEADLDAGAHSALIEADLQIVETAPRTEDMGHTNVVSVGENHSMTAASDPRSDGAAFVAHYARRHRATDHQH